MWLVVTFNSNKWSSTVLWGCPCCRKFSWQFSHKIFTTPSNIRWTPVIEIAKLWNKSLFRIQEIRYVSLSPPLCCVSGAQSFGNTFWKPSYLIIFASLCFRSRKVLQFLPGASMSPDDIEGRSCYQQSRYHSAQQESRHVQLMFRVGAQIQDCWQLCLLTTTHGCDSQNTRQIQ